MSLTKIIVGLSVVGLCACAPAAEQSVQIDVDVINQESVHSVEAQAVETKKSKMSHSHRETVKPGANVTLNSVLPKSMTSGTYQTVRLELADGYADGMMSVEVVPSNGLSLFGGNNSKTFNMVAEGPHIWNLDVKSDVDGVYFLNVFASAKGQARSFSVRLNMGTVTQKMFDDAMPADGELVDGGKIRVMDAEETIK